ncbi:MAG TPA: DNA polymerase III subunit alpha [bacterium]|nr:DNA polymerase III subunit alpha [bacterium]
MYVPLDMHSYYSFLSSPASVEDLVGAASRFGMPGVAITDYDGIYGAVPLYKAARKRGIKPILGAELSLDNRSRIVLLIKDGVGYRNLSRLITSLIDRPEGILRLALAGHCEGLVCLSGCRRGPVAQAILAHQPEKAVQEAAGFREIFGEDFFLEMHWGPDSRDRWLLSEIAALGRRLGVPYLAVPNAHYVDPSDEMLYRILVSIRTGTALHYRHPEKELRLPLDFPEAVEMARRFRDYPEALENTFRAAERCELQLSLGRTVFPHFPLPEGESAASYLRKLCFAGAIQRYGDLSESIRERLEYELRTIQQVGYSEYFLMTWDICREAHRRGIWAVARGSAADSMVCHALGISHVCPVRYNLYFERFLNPERMIHSGLADIDLDLPWDRRDEMVEYVYQRYGAEHCATICSMVRMHPRTAVAEVGKVLGLPEREIRSLTKRLPYGSAERLEERIRALPECADLPVDREPLRTLLAIAKRLEGVPRHTGMHPCGLVVSREPLTHLVPLQKSAKGPVVTQFDMEPVEELGLVKIDLLGQAGLTVISETIDTIRRQHGIEINPYEIPEDDPETWDLIASGQARGCFQIESPAMCNLLKMLNCRDMECLIAALSIIRPGASNHGKMQQFSRRYQGTEAVTYPHPALKPVLERTYGVMVYEEHVLMIAHAFAGMNLGRADLLRRALTKWNCRNTVEEFEGEFRRGACAKGYADKEIDTVWRYITEFSGYAFNKAHSASYAILAYQAAYLKAHYPAAFLAAVLSSGRGFYSRLVYTLEARRLGVGFLLPDFNASDLAQFTVEGDQVRVPLEQVKEVPGKAARQIVEERGVRGRFKSLEDLIRRVRIDVTVLRALIRCGAGDCWGVPRPALLWEMESLTRQLTRAGADESGPQMSLFEPEKEARFAVSRCHRDYPLRRKMEIEMELLGFTVSGHPLDYYDGYLDWRKYTPISSLPQYPNATVTVCGTIVERRTTRTTKGDYMKFVSVADRTGIAELVLFPAVYREYGRLTAGNGVLEYDGTVDLFENRNGFVVNVHAVRTVLASAALV